MKPKLGRADQLRELRLLANHFRLRLSENDGSPLADRMIRAARAGLSECALACDRDIVDAIWEECDLDIDKPRHSV